MPIVATVLFCEAAAQSDIIMGFLAFGVLRSWWKDLLNLHDPKKGVILSRIARWALLGGIFVRLLVATRPEEYVACAILFAFVWLWRIGKLPRIWQAIREACDKVGQTETQIDDRAEIVVIQHANAPRQNSTIETIDSKTEKYKMDAEKALMAFRKREAEVRALQDALMARLEKLEGGC
jgi:hypothetical protein